jgi:MATE family multidrug resistance protein
VNDRATRGGLGAELGRTLRLAGPIIASQLGQTGMNTADTIQVGPLGPEALAAAGIGSSIHIVAFFLIGGIVIGMGPLVSQAWGARNIEECKRVARQGFWMALILSVPTTLLMLVGEPLALVFGQQRSIASGAGAYMAALAPGVPAAILFLAMRQYLEGMGHTAPPMIATIGGLGLNVLMNHLLIWGIGPFPELGVIGSGYATSIVRWAMVLSLVVYVLLHPEFDPLRRAPRGAWAADRTRMTRIARIGAPIGLQYGLEIGLFAFAALMMGWFGALQVAAHQVTINIAATTFMVALGTSMAGSIRVGQTIGAQAPTQTRAAVLATYLLTLGFMGLCAIAFVIAPRALIGLYTEDPGILALGQSLLLVAAAFQIFDGGQVAGISVLRGAGDTQVPMLIAAAGYWIVGLALALWLGFRTDLGPVGIWIGLAAGLAAVAFALAYRVRVVMWRAVPSALVEQPELGA